LWGHAAVGHVVGVRSCNGGCHTTNHGESDAADSNFPWQLRKCLTCEDHAGHWTAPRPRSCVLPSFGQ
jgi:hypothetical protein